jgi:tetratricopeptide (TPR) repeat protein
MANLVLKLGPDIHDVAREQLRSALTARRQKQSQVLALSLLETANAERSHEILRTIFTLGGSTFVVGIARERIKALLKSGELQAALGIATSLMTIASDSPDAWYLSAQVSRQAGKPADARRAALEAARLFHTAGAVTEEEECYNEALAAEPSNLDVKMTLADYLVREHREDEAVAQFLSIIAAAESAGNTDLLVDSLNRAVQIAPANADLREKLAMALEPIAPDSAIENWLQVAWQLQEDKQHDRARRVFGHVLTLNPQNESALQGILDHVKHRGELDAAASYTVALAEVKASRKNFGEACRLFQSYLELDPDNLDMLERLSALAGKSNDAEVFSTTTRALAKKFQKLGDNENALRHYELLIERQPGDAVLLAALLDCSAAAGNREKGLTYARQLLSVARETEDPERIRLAAATILNYDDEDADAHHDLAEALLSLNRVPQAATEFLRGAELFEERGNTTSALLCYRRTTQISPSTVQAWRRLGEMAMDAGDTDTARKSLSHVLDVASEGDKHRVAHLLERILQALPDDVSLHKTALDHYRKAGDVSNVVREYLWLAHQAETSGDHETAFQILTDALAFAPSADKLKKAHYKMVRQLGRVEELQMRLRQQADEHESNGRLEEAIIVRKELTLLLPGQVSQHRELAQLLEKANSLSDALEEHLQIIQLLLDKSELEQAREHAESTVQKYPSDSGCRVKIADVLIRSAYPDLAARYYSIEAEAAIAQKNYDVAIDLLEKAVTARPAWIKVRQLLADVLAKAGRSEDAFQTSILVSQAMIEAGELSQATETLNQLRIQRPDSPDIREQLADLHGRSGKRKEQASILSELADLYRNSGDTTRALHVYRKLMALTPDDPIVLSHYVEVLAQANVPPDELPQEYTRLADAFARKGDYEAASQTYEQALGLAPDSTSARSRFASFLLSRGSKQRALNEMRKLGTLYVERNEPMAAVEVLNAALTISPRDADLCLALATAQDAAGMLEDAKVSYARASAILASTAAVKGVDTYRRILTQDEHNTAVRLRLVELLMNAGDKMEAAREARILAEIHINRGELSDAEHVYRLIDDCAEESMEDVQEAILRDSYDPSLQYVHYVRLGNRHFNCGNIDGALDAYRTARSLHDDQPELKRKPFRIICCWLRSFSQAATTAKRSLRMKRYVYSIRLIMTLDVDLRLCMPQTVKKPLRLKPTTMNWC